MATQKTIATTEPVTDSPAFDLVNLIAEREKQIGALFEALALSKEEFDNRHDFGWAGQALVGFAFKEMHELADRLWEQERIAKGYTPRSELPKPDDRGRDEL